MLLIIALCVLVSFSCGLLLVHWLGLAALSLAVTAIVLLAMPWDLLLVPKWFAALFALQLAWFGGNVVKISREDGSRKLSDDESLPSAKIAEQRKGPRVTPPAGFKVTKLGTDIRGASSDQLRLGSRRRYGRKKPLL
jgi:membrane protein implicated in regulation of membrane protease activity